MSDDEKQFAQSLFRAVESLGFEVHDSNGAYETFLSLNRQLQAFLRMRYMRGLSDRNIALILGELESDVSKNILDALYRIGRSL